VCDPACGRRRIAAWVEIKVNRARRNWLLEKGKKKRKRGKERSRKKESRLSSGRDAPRLSTAWRFSFLKRAPLKPCSIGAALDDALSQTDKLSAWQDWSCIFPAFRTANRARARENNDRNPPRGRLRGWTAQELGVSSRRGLHLSMQPKGIRAAPFGSIRLRPERDRGSANRGRRGGRGEGGEGGIPRIRNETRSRVAKFLVGGRRDSDDEKKSGR